MKLRLRIPCGEGPRQATYCQQQQKGGDQVSNSVSKFEPPDYTIEGWKSLVDQGTNLANRPGYDGMTVAPWNGTQDAAAGLIAEQALHGSPDATAARASNLATSEGAYLGNPYLNQGYVNSVIGDNAGVMANAYATGAAADQARNANMAGALGGGGDKAMQLAGQQGLERAVGQMANQFQLGNSQIGATDYRAGTGQMLGANSQAPAFGQMDLANNAAFMGVGNSQNQYMQALLNAGKNNYDQPIQNLGLLQSILQAASGGQGSTTTANYGGQPSWVTGGLGAGAGLLGAYYGMGK